MTFKEEVKVEDVVEKVKETAAAETTAAEETKESTTQETTAVEENKQEEEALPKEDGDDAKTSQNESESEEEPE